MLKAIIRFPLLFTVLPHYYTKDFTMAPKCYKGTEYFFIIRNLLANKAAKSISKEKCPKCFTEIQSYFALMTHIEMFHPNDVKHKPCLKQEYNEILDQNSDSFETPNESPEMVIEDFDMFKANNPFTDSSTLDGLKDNPFFEVFLIYFNLLDACLTFFIINRN